VFLSLFVAKKLVDYADKTSNTYLSYIDAVCLQQQQTITTFSNHGAGSVSNPEL